MIPLLGVLVFAAVVDQIDSGVAAVEVQTDRGIQMWSLECRRLPFGGVEGQPLKIRLRRLKRRRADRGRFEDQGIPPDFRIRSIRSVQTEKERKTP